MQIGYVTKQQLRQPSIERAGLIWFQPRTRQKYWVSRIRGKLALTPFTIAYTRRPRSQWRWAYRLHAHAFPLREYPTFDEAAEDAAQLMHDDIARRHLRDTWART
jgi:hypothetical protein